MLFRLPLILLLLVSLVGCAGQRVSVDYQPGTAFGLMQTFGWAEGDSSELAARNGLMERRIRDAIAQQLRWHGYSEASADPDFLVDFRLQDVQRVRYHTYYDDPFFWGYHRPYFGPVFSRTVAEPYIERILTLDVLDPERRLVWRGSYSGRPSSAESPAEREAEIQAQIQAILQHFPP
ncbi:hypothetical protein GCM10011348_22440 [Marinobacterium nitratireducens]|uniref:DUF4136 domain-containing protein n=1 Tax=Marinobacterium nitratireducens TaxID=518897 RepID=A0A918DTT2_9GAMM|nr:DUF4136 domain-containing protein [Marinobacterium nitratireducens]GGO82035.1 hypothetical protein GCM10011348_22440 [Marinobacterium nitratireducens]